MMKVLHVTPQIHDEQEETAEGCQYRQWWICE